MSAPPKHDRLVDALVVLLFPGYFLYHVLVAQAFIPAFLGGYSSAAALPVVPFVALAYARHLLTECGGGGFRFSISGS